MSEPVVSLLPGLRWQSGRLDQWQAVDLSRLYRVRQSVFVIEQNCAYLDADEADEYAWHIAAWAEGHPLPVACARLVDPAVKYREPSMGRVLTHGAGRGTGLGRELVRRVLNQADRVFPGQGVRISAQSQLQRFYGEAGFVSVGAEYLEDNIPHIEMLRV